MGCLVDTYVITEKKEWRNIMDYAVEKHYEKIMKEIPVKYHPMMKALMDSSHSINAILFNSPRVTVSTFSPLRVIAMSFETDDIKFDAGREECLKKVLRDTFYDIILVALDDTNEDKTDYYYIISSINDMQILDPINLNMEDRQLFFGR